MTEQQYRSIADRDKGDAIDWDAKPDLRTRVADLVPLSLLDGRDPRRDVFEVADQIFAVVQASVPTREQIVEAAEKAGRDWELMRNPEERRSMGECVADAVLALFQNGADRD